MGEAFPLEGVHCKMLVFICVMAITGIALAVYNAGKKENMR